MFSYQRNTQIKCPTNKNYFTILHLFKVAPPDNGDLYDPGRLRHIHQLVLKLHI